MDVGQIVSLIKSRDESGLAHLYDHYSSALNGIITRIVGSEKVAEEVLQQTFLKIWEKIDQFDPNKASLFTWMVRIARNTAIDKRRLKSFQNHNQVESLDVKHNTASVTMQVHSDIDANNLLGKLEEKQKEVIEIVYLEGYSHSEAAKRLNIPLGTVKTRIRMGLKKLRAELSVERKLFLGSLLLIIIYFILS